MLRRYLARWNWRLVCLCRTTSVGLFWLRKITRNASAT